ncbi:hypothetical protein [[Phormidium] sp. ETS-05]|uniref:hypothetical protein n=1 Tax=[Phormidium] sp. ETS-05 TaxID=222819 RepID=UPI001E52A66B|nr:hypothetical protein [[Phormidium] sp. ETS-05]
MKKQLVKQLVIFGATGNLSQIYLISSLFLLWRQGERVKLIAVALENFSTEEYCTFILNAMKEKGSAPEGIDEDWASFCEDSVTYVSLDLMEAINYDVPEVA